MDENQNKLLSERINKLIIIYTTKVTSMEETAQNCIHYNYIISELYSKMNYIKRLEMQLKTNTADFLHHEKFIFQLENETHKILQEELLIKQLSEVSTAIDLNQNLLSPNDKINSNKEGNNLSSNEKSSFSNSNPTNNQNSNDKILFQSSNEAIIEVDISMSDIIKGNFIIEDKKQK